ncbi:MAG: hypothetical protein RIM23_12585, partial [Coleofasciculus sp. G3-WIS-01]|uniref:hypothetical protein n=1 Tax=Coleofasciculus sp. G3-WIS-01 TaxID=3069528 RepID=UPI0032F4EBA0
TCIYITTIVERYPNYLTGEFIRYLDGSLGFISQLKSVGAFTHRLNGNSQETCYRNVSTAAIADNRYNRAI